MWKKLFVMLVALIGTLTIGYAYYDFKMNASTSTYAIGGTLTG